MEACGNWDPLREWFAMHTHHLFLHRYTASQSQRVSLNACFTSHITDHWPITNLTLPELAAWTNHAWQPPNTNMWPPTKVALCPACQHQLDLHIDIPAFFLNSQIDTQPNPLKNQRIQSLCDVLVQPFSRNPAIVCGPGTGS